MNEQIIVDGLKVNYSLTGHGHPVLILHGWGSRSNAWLNVQNKLSENSSFKIIIPDLIGFGQSDLPKIGWNMDNYVDWLELFITELSSRHPEFKNPIFLMGHSFGGRISIKAAARGTIPIKGLILCGAAGLKSETSVKLQIISDIAKSGSDLIDKMHLGRLKIYMRDFYYHLLRQNDYLNVPRVMRDTFRKVIEEDLAICLPSIHQKTLIVWGAEDRVVPVKQAYRFHQGIIDSRLEVMPCVGHSPQLERPDELAEILLNFFKTCNYK